MDVVGLRGNGLKLVPVEASLHLENALRWMNDPEITACLEVNTGITRRQEEAYFERIGLGPDDEFHWAIVSEALGHVGFIGLRQVHWRNRNAVGGIVVGERSAWGKGVATEAVRVRTRFAFETLGLHRVDGHTINPSMARVYLKNGYVREGVARRKMWREGRWRDVELFSILDDDDFGSP